MAQPYVGEIRMFAGTFAPAGWEFCHGQLQAIVENEALYQLLGTTYGGDGVSTFALPNLQSRIPIHWGNGGGSSYQLAETGGVETVTITTQQFPAHTHPMLATNDVATLTDPGGNVSAQTGTFDGYQSAAGNQPMAAASIGSVGGSQPHDNLQPYLGINYIMSLFGLFPQP